MTEPSFADLPARAFTKADPSPDPLFYAQPRLVTHIDDDAIAVVTELYRELLPSGGAILDLMSSWVSHLPPEVRYGSVTGHGMNAVELDANGRLDRRLVRDLNADPSLPLPDASFDAACICVSVQYLQQPVSVLRDVRRALRPGGQCIITFSNRCFPTKAVAVWGALDGAGRRSLVSAYLDRAGFAAVQAFDPVGEDGPGDPLHAVIGTEAGTEAEAGGH